MYTLTYAYQRSSPQGHILKSLALASKPQVLKNCSVFGLRTALFFESLKFSRSPEKIFEDRFFLDRLKKNLKTFFWRELATCVLGPWPWPRLFLPLASRGSVLGRAVLGLGLGLVFCLCPWPRALCLRLQLWYTCIHTSTPHDNKQTVM